MGPPRLSTDRYKPPPARRSGSVAKVTGACVCDAASAAWATVTQEPPPIPSSVARAAAGPLPRAARTGERVAPTPEAPGERRVPAGVEPSGEVSMAGRRAPCESAEHAPGRPYRETGPCSETETTASAVLPPPRSDGRQGGGAVEHLRPGVRRRRRLARAHPRAIPTRGPPPRRARPPRRYPRAGVRLRGGWKGRPAVRGRDSGRFVPVLAPRGARTPRDTRKSTRKHPLAPVPGRCGPGSEAAD